MKHNVLIYSVVTERWMNLLNGEQLDADLLSHNLQVSLNMKWNSLDELPVASHSREIKFIWS